MKSAILIFLLLAGFNLRAQTVAELRSQADAGDAAAMVSLSEKFRFGDGIVQSEDSANLWMKKAAAKEHPAALYFLGAQKVSQIFSAKDFDEGMKLLKKAAEKDELQALLKLHQITHAKKPGVPTEADRYYSQTEAFKYISRAAQLRDPGAMLITGNMLLAGTGTTRNDSLGVIWVKKSAEDYNHIPAWLRLADLLFEGKVTGQPDYPAALKIYQRIKTDKRAGIDSRAHADIGIHNVDQIYKKANVLQTQSSPLIPGDGFQYILRD